MTAVLWRGRPPSAPALVLALATAAFMAMPLVYVLYRGLTGGADTWERLWDTRLPSLLWDDDRSWCRRVGAHDR